MILMACNCLNVRVHCHGELLELTNDNNSDLSEGCKSDPFFSLQCYKMFLDLGGVTVSQKLLSSTRDVDEWKITTCVHCDLDVCASHADKPDQVRLNANLMKDPGRIKAIMELENYSPLFKMILPKVNGNFIQNNQGIDFQNGILDRTIDSVQSQITAFLNQECAAMNERIKKYSEMEQATYTELLQKVRKDKQAMVYLLLKSKKIMPNTDTSSTESPITSPESTINKNTVTESSTSTDSAFDRSEISESSHDKSLKPRTLRRTVSNPVHSLNKTKKQIQHAPRIIDVGGVFDMEEFDTKECNAKHIEYDSGDYSDGSEDNTDVIPELRNEKKELNDMNRIFPSSLPVSVPAFSNLAHYTGLEDDDDEIPHLTDPEQIAASFRAVASSVCDGTEMFGDLPRRRLNTGELLASRPF